jgi:hypothetical protein
LWQTRLLPWQTAPSCRLDALFAQAAASSNKASDSIRLTFMSFLRHAAPAGIWALHTHSTAAHAAAAHSLSAPSLIVMARDAAALTGSTRFAAGRIVAAGCDAQQQER